MSNYRPVARTGESHEPPTPVPRREWRWHWCMPEIGPEHQDDRMAAIRDLAALTPAELRPGADDATTVREAKDWTGAVTRIVGAVALLMMLSIVDANVEAALACSVSDIQIKQANLVHSGSGGQFSTVVGELVNGCSEATGVQLHITLRDATGRIIATGDPWPAGMHNIPPQRPYAFTVNAAEDGGGADRLKVDVTEVIRW
jgi:hypothetical protein